MSAFSPGYLLPLGDFETAAIDRVRLCVCFEPQYTVIRRQQQVAPLSYAPDQDENKLQKTSRSLGRIRHIMKLHDERGLPDGNV